MCRVNNLGLPQISMPACFKLAPFFFLGLIAFDANDINCKIYYCICMLC